MGENVIDHTWPLSIVDQPPWPMEPWGSDCCRCHGDTEPEVSCQVATAEHMGIPRVAMTDSWVHNVSARSVVNIAVTVQLSYRIVHMYDGTTVVVYYEPTLPPLHFL